MFEKSEFLNLGAQERETRLTRLRSELNSPIALEALRAAAHAFSRLENPHQDEVEKGVGWLNAFAIEIGISGKKTDLNTFRRFLTGATKVPRALNLATVALFALHIAGTHSADQRITRLIFGIGDERKPLFSAIRDFVLSGNQLALVSSEFSRATPTAPVSNSIDLKGAFPAMIEILTQKNPEEEDVWQHFGGGNYSGKQPKIMYFLTYRYSTTRGNILKGFLVVKHHPGTGFGHFRFSHFVWGGPENLYIFRETHGLMLSCDKAYYLLGYGMTISGNKRDGMFRRTKEYKELRAKPQVQTFELATIEYDEFELRDVVLSGLTMASAALHQPVVSRLAVLCLGTDKELSRELFDDEVVPTELPFRSLEQDISDTLRRLVDIGVSGFDRRLGFKKSSKHADSAVIAQCARRIETIIDNTAHWEKSGQNEHANRNAKNAGAIETEGDGRPRP